MGLGGDASRAARVDLTGISRELFEVIWIKIIELFDCDVVATARHLAIRAAEVHCSFFGFRSHGSKDV